MFVLACASAVLLLVIVRSYRNAGKYTHTGKSKPTQRDRCDLKVFDFILCEHYHNVSVLQTRNVEYDEVVLSPTTASIPTEHNKAYVTTTPIPTDQNVAYGVHSSN